MSRPREFCTSVLLQQAGELFIKRGYAATSIDEIVKVSGAARGSLYSIFGSKQGIFVAALKLAAGQSGEFTAVSDHGAVNNCGSEQAASTVLLDLLNVAIFEIASRNREISDLVQQIIDERGITAQVLGQRALDRVGLTEAQSRASEE